MQERSREGLILPYAVVETEIKDKGKKRTITKDRSKEMTVATILIETENKRTKAGGLIFKKTDEHIFFVSKLYYPLILVPWREGKYILFDGMTIWNYTFGYNKLPDVDMFKNNIESGAERLDAFQDVLAKTSETFINFADEEKINISGLFIHEELMSDLLSYMDFANVSEEGKCGYLVPQISIETLTAQVTKLKEIIDWNNNDISKLSEAVKLVNEKKDYWKKEITEKIESVSYEYNAKIQSIKPEVKNRVEKLQREMRHELAPLQDEIMDIEHEILDCMRERAKWEEYKQKCMVLMNLDGVNEADDNIREIAGTIGGLRYDQKTVGAKKREIEDYYNELIEKELEKIRVIERARDAKVTPLSNEIKGMETVVTKITGDINNLITKKKQSIDFIEKQGVATPIGAKTQCVYLPIYIARFDGEKGSRFLVYPPMIAKSRKGIFGGLKSLVGKIVLPLEPRTGSFDKIFKKSVEEAIEKNKNIAKIFSDAGINANILHDKDGKNLFASGLEQLKQAGWIKEKRQKEFTEVFEKHFSVGK